MNAPLIVLVAALIMGCHTPQQQMPREQPTNVVRRLVPDEYLVVPGNRAGSVFLGMPLFLISQDFATAASTLESRGLLVELDEQSRVICIIATKPGYGTSKGVVVGDPPSAVYEAYGQVPPIDMQLSEAFGYTCKAILYRGIAFLLSNSDGLVWGIQIRQQWPAG